MPSKTKLGRKTKPKTPSPRNAVIKQQAEERALAGKPPLKSRRPRVRVGRSPMGRAWSTEEKMDLFIAALRKTHNIGHACELADTERHYMYQLKREYPDFRKRWIDAWEEGIDTLEAEAHRRAMEGSDILLMFMLNGNRSQKYRERKGGDTVVNMPGSFTLNISGKVDEDGQVEEQKQLEEPNTIDLPPEDYGEVVDNE